MAYTWEGMRKISWEQVIKYHRNGELVGCFRLYDDDTEGMIEPDYSWEEICKHHACGGEFGEER